MLPYQAEIEMYEPVQRWLKRFLSERFKKGKVSVYDAHATNLSSLIENNILHNNLSSDWITWEIRIDIVGFVQLPETTILAFVECKNTALSLDHLAQLLGYARIARPTFAFLVSPQGTKRPLSQLLKTYQRLDVLEYAQENGKLPRSLIVARWNPDSDSIDSDSIITSDIQKVTLGRLQ